MDDKGAPKSLFTPLFICYTIWLFISSLVGGKLQGKLGRKLMVRISLILQFLAAMSFIALNYIDNVPFFLVVGFLGRTIQGMGAGLLQTAAYSELLIQFPHIQKQLVSLMEFGAVCGGFTGLIFSAFLSYFVGFVGPFAFCGCCFLFFAIMQDCLIHFVDSKQLPEEQKIIQTHLESKIKISGSVLQPQLKQDAVIKNSVLQTSALKLSQNNMLGDSNMGFSHDKKQTLIPNSLIENHQQQAPIQYDKINYFHILFTTRGIFACLDIAMNLQTFYYNDTIMADQLKEVYKLDVSIISLIYSIQSVGFMMTAHFAPKLVHRFSLVGVVIVAQLIQAAAAFLVGPSLMLHIPEYIAITIVGFFISGLASPFSIVSPYSELEYCLEAHKDKNFNPEEVQDIVSGVFNSSYALGGITGPLFGGYVNRATNFRTTSDIQALILIGIALLQLVIVYIPMKVKEFKQHKKLEQTQSGDGTIMKFEASSKLQISNETIDLNHQDSNEDRDDEQLRLVKVESQTDTSK
eukprot:403358969